VAAAIAAALLPAWAGEPGPSFDCGRVSSQVNRMICASPALSALDRELALQFNNLRGQPAIDKPALEREESTWVREVKNACADAECLARVYRQRIAELRQRSQHAASPAAAEETQPFQVEAVLWLEAQRLRGNACELGPRFLSKEGYTAVPGGLPVVGNGSVVYPRRRRGADFAFLVATSAGCKVLDVVALPPPSQAGRLEQCYVLSDDDSATPRSVGIGVRSKDRKIGRAYWEVDLAQGRLVRQPLSVLGWSEALRCQQPESGE
jgi:uncharacterized protein YecT (DUF1311 family)